jgi:predicted metal-dependent hydrolase
MTATQPLLVRGAGAIAYRLSVSPRARRISIRVSPRDGVRVTVPRRHDLREVERFIDSKREWIAKHLGRFEALRLAAPPATRPDMIELPALGERWSVVYRETAVRRVTVRMSPGAQPPPAAAEGRGSPPQLALFPATPAVAARELQVTGAIGDTRAVLDALRRWLRGHAAASLLPWLRALSAELDLPFTRVAVRGQRTRWGSCTAQRAISLNWKLVLLPRAAARYVLVHELAHTRHLNHSARFWTLVERHEPGYATLRTVLREAGGRMPAWVDGSTVREDDQR